MAKESTLELSPEAAKEMPMVDLVHELLKQSDEPLYYRDLAKKVAELKGFTESEMLAYMAQLYTEINIDGRFICVGRSLWGLKERYTMDQATDAAVAANVKEDDDMYLDDEDSEYDEKEVDDEEDLIDTVEVDYPEGDIDNIDD